jgi:ABC-type nitrate/sulfonate/bicarbonate transport system ATPase subunit
MADYRKVEEVKAAELRGIRKSFLLPDGTELPVLAGIDFSVDEGEFVTMVGLSGCGKTTLLNIIAGLDKPTEGEVFIDGRKSIKLGKDLTMIFQENTLFPWKTVEQNVEFGLKAAGIDQDRDRIVSEALLNVGLEKFAKYFPHQLSTGMKQKVAIARALVLHPKVLLMDEPFSSLDAFTRLAFQDDLCKILEGRELTTIFVTHDVEEAIYLSTRIIVLSPRPAEVAEIVRVNLRRPRSSETRISDEFIRAQSLILSRLRKDFAGCKNSIG